VRGIEYQHQCAVVQYLNMNYPNILFNADFGGMRTTWRQAVKAKTSGHKKGFPDIFICEPRRYWHGLFIEMKAPKGEDNAKGVLKPEQKEWLNKLSVRGYCTAVCFGAQEAYQVIDAYFSV